MAKESRAVKSLRAGWMKKKAEIFAGKLTKPDSEDPNTVNHLDWYEATGFKRPYPGEKKVLPASAFNHGAPTKADDDE
jgi:hypothetical protein